MKFCAKLRISERKTKKKLVFLVFPGRKCFRAFQRVRPQNLGDGCYIYYTDILFCIEWAVAIVNKGISKEKGLKILGFETQNVNLLTC